MATSLDKGSLFFVNISTYLLPDPDEEDIGNISGSFPRSHLISDNTFFYLEICLNGAAAGLISLFGVFANIVNIAVFVKQGLKETAMVSLLLLSIFDLGMVLFTLYQSVLLPFFLSAPDYNVNRRAFHYVTVAIPRTRIIGSSVGLVNLVGNIGLNTTAAVLLVVTSTIMLLATRSSAKFRKAVAGRKDETTARNTRLVNVIVGLSVLFLLGNLPMMMVRYAKEFVLELGPFGQYQNLNQTLYALIYVVTAINSSANIFVYLLVSTRYKEVLMSTFWNWGSASNKK